MKEKTIHISSMLNRMDYNALRNYFMFRKHPKRTRLLVISLLCSILLMVISDTSYGMPFFRPLGLIVFLLVTAAYFWISHDVRKLELNIRDMFNKKQEITFDESGFSVKWAKSNAAEYPWKAVEFAVEMDAYFFLFIEKYYALTIPKIELKDYVVEDLRDIMMKHIALTSELSGFKARV